MFLSSSSKIRGRNRPAVQPTHQAERRVRQPLLLVLCRHFIPPVLAPHRGRQGVPRFTLVILTRHHSIPTETWIESSYCVIESTNYCIASKSLPGAPLSAYARLLRRHGRSRRLFLSRSDFCLSPTRGACFGTHLRFLTRRSARGNRRSCPGREGMSNSAKRIGIWVDAGVRSPCWRRGGITRQSSSASRASR